MWVRTSFTRVWIITLVVLSNPRTVKAFEQISSWAFLSLFGFLMRDFTIEVFWPGRKITIVSVLTVYPFKHNPKSAHLEKKVSTTNGLFFPTLVNTISVCCISVYYKPNNKTCVNYVKKTGLNGRIDQNGVFLRFKFIAFWSVCSVL